jgi:hypothetical protein
MDLTTGGFLDMVHAFEDYAGRGQAWVATYSGGFGPSYLEEILIYMDLDGDDGALYGGAPFSAALDTSGYANPSDVYIGFWYTTDGGTYAWSYSIDDIYVYTFITGVPAFLWCTYDPALEFQMTSRMAWIHSGSVAHIPSPVITGLMTRELTYGSMISIMIVVHRYGRLMAQVWITRCTRLLSLAMSARIGASRSS